MPSLLKHPFLRKHFHQLWRFAICGGIGACIDLGTLRLLVHNVGVSAYIAPIYSTLLSASFVFVANKFFTFRDKRKQMGSQVLRFAMVYGVAIAMNILLTTAFIAAGVHYLLAKCLAIGIGMFWNYFMSHGFIFKRNEPVDVAVF